MDSEEEKVVQELFELTAYQGKSYYALAELLNSQGLRSHCGARISGFLYKERYKEKDSIVAENLKPKYNCFQRARRLRDCYKQFCGWAEEFELAPLVRKRIILSQLLGRVELGKGYEVTLYLKLTYRQFVNLTGQEKAA